MPALNFQKQFVMPILTGTKTSTIRTLRKDGRAHCKPGDTLKLYYGMRTKQCELISEVRCTKIVAMQMNIDDGELKIRHAEYEGVNPFVHPMMPEEYEPLAKMEGFKNVDEMSDWFLKNHPDIEAILICWQIQWEAL